jgi:hypothetical protein
VSITEWEKPLYELAKTNNVNITDIARKYSPTYFDKRDFKVSLANLNTPSLYLLEKLFSREQMIGWLMVQLQGLNEFCGKRIKMNERQMEELAYVMYHNAPHTRLNEVLGFIFLFKSGHFGEFYGEIDPLRISSAYHKFRTEDIHKIRNEVRKYNPPLA